MSETIKDGTGAGYVARVDNQNRLWADTIQTPRITERAENGFSYNFSIIDIPLSGGVDTAVMYIKNTDPSMYLYVNDYDIGWNGGDANHNRCLILYSKIATGGTGIPTSGYNTSGGQNLLLGTTSAATADFRFWDKTTPGGMVLPSAAVGAVGLICAQGMTYHQLDGALIIPPGVDRLLSLKAEETGLASLTVHTYYAPHGN